MAAFLSKVFPRKKEKETNKRSSVSSLLEGKFEAVSPTVSPTAAKFEENAQKQKERGREKEKEKDKDAGFSLFRPKSRPLSPAADARKTASDAPHLTLNLPVPKEERSRALGVVFEADSEDRSVLPDDVIGERRLNPLEALLLVKACSSAIIANGGLETLGVMHPFWYSASPEVQRKLISLFILSLAPKSPISTLSPSPTSALSTFGSELEYTRSPHDIAAVLRWALRHVRLEGDSFGRTEGQWQWYQTFSEAERASSYPMSAFSDSLVPQVPPSHLQLLVATLDIVSSLAAHSEHNGISGSKLSKFFGLWLLTTKRSERDDDWSSFYARWERAGRILEHLFLAHIRDEMVRKKMPLRLSELVRGYPFGSSSGSASSGDADLLPRPRLSTRQYDALYVRIETQVPDDKSTKRKQHPLRLISDALKSDVELGDSKYKELWEAVKKAALANDEPEPILIHVDGYPSISRIFADETLRLLSLIPAESPTSATSSVPTIRSPRPPRRRSSSLNSSAKANGNGKATSNGSAASRSATSPTSAASPKDWMDFSTSGFGESAIGKDLASTLLDKDVEVTAPPVERNASKKRKASPGRSRRSSVDNPDPESASRAAHLTGPPPPKSKSTAVDLVKLDEAFIDFWSDALLDPISADWPDFVVAQLKALPGLELEGRTVSWLVLEQRFVPLPPPPPPPEPETVPLKRASSPRPSMRSELSARKSSTLAAAKKRLTFFSSAQTLGGLSSSAKAESKTFARKKAKPTRVGEMGEILPEEGPAGAEQETAQQPGKQEEAQNVREAAPKETPTAPPADVPKGSEPAAEDPKAAVPPIASSPAAPSLTPAAMPSPATTTTEAMSPLTPTAEDFPPVPVVDGLPSATATTSATVEPLKTEDVASEDKPVLASPHEPSVPSDATPPDAATSATEVDPEVPHEKTLPPAPEPVVLTGETPGPQVALSMSEPAALAEISAKVDDVIAQAASSPEVDRLPADASAAAQDQQTTEVTQATAVVEEVVPFATQAEADAAVEEAAAKEKQEESPAVEAVAVEAGVPPIAAAVAAAGPTEPEPAPAAEAAFETPVAEDTAQAGQTVVSEEPLIEPSPAAPELVQEEPEHAAAEESTPTADVPALSEPVDAVEADVAKEDQHDASVERAEEEDVHADNASAPTAVPHAEEVKDEENTVVEDVAAPTAEELIVEPVAEESVVPGATDEPAATQHAEDPVESAVEPAGAPAAQLTVPDAVVAEHPVEESPAGAQPEVEDAQATVEETTAESSHAEAAPEGSDNPPAESSVIPPSTESTEIGHAVKTGTEKGDEEAPSTEPGTTGAENPADA
ncbi:hypothetical protein BD414DRAFT_458132 [Trametes punicea]|nr:hypothetical protein BD414DRAFT_458132 [Trametes punicea]